MTNYDQTFFDYVNAGAVRSAQHVIPLVRDLLPVDTVLDVGCGQGAWLSVWAATGVDITGVDGAYVNRSRLLIPSERFHALDLAQPFNLSRRFALVQSLEVAEHLPHASAAGFVASLIQHADAVLFSAAPKGQGGDHHINEQPYDYWRGLFAAHGFIAVDALRPRLRDAADVEPWYRYNTLLYVGPALWPRLTPQVQACRLPADRPIPDVSPLPYRMRKRAVALLPVSAMTLLAKYKERRVARGLKRPAPGAM